MSAGVIILLVIVGWLFVLAPLFLRRQRPIRKAGAAFDKTRLVHQGGTDLGDGMRRRPRVLPGDLHATSSRVNREELLDDDTSDSDSEEAVIEDSHVNLRLGGILSARRVHRERDEEEASAFVDGSVVSEIEAPEDELPEVAEDVEDFDGDIDESCPYSFDGAYLAPEDVLHPGGDYEEYSVHAPAAMETSDVDEEAVDDSTDLTDEEREFAALRRGRGTWDPDFDAVISSHRYRRRQITLAVLAALTVLSIVLGIVVGGWMWLAVAVTGVLLGGYLMALRTQVHQEEQLRLRRIRQLRRARMGVRHRDDEALHIPRNLRRPGAVVLELDDESPDFYDLDTTYSGFSARPVEDYDDLDDADYIPEYRTQDPYESRAVG